ncbi:hypothetical protein MKQ70_23640 [Chitinophaga sedimenti]|uniref:hypothetical protein n=1 Tax=Chitinophaga sedimenti TaxID=2033606 RepID=UPI002003C8D8|nr:hypothetical protein [Chitinophaga sedimenti]MCK7557836.1 hypothetical protein [Chitinophaga sedimenti]
MKKTLQKALAVMALVVIGFTACDDETKVCNSKTDTFAGVSFKYRIPPDETTWYATLCCRR